ncbi:MAG: hypothetical protein D6702_03500 [Planctomycetota bacterium]|nr:MAG: hypothetical protein D6702_03500 [Planctomycetota bacterium]
MSMTLRRLLTAASCLLLAAAAPAQAHKELGKMWTFEGVPLDYFESEHGFVPDEAWLERVRLSALKFGGGCSSSFISPRGLVLTNHHCARGHVAEASPEDQDWLGEGFIARSLAEEPRLRGLELRQLVEMFDVTDEMNAGIDPGDDEATIRLKLRDNRQQILARSRREAPDLEPQVVSLYQGGVYALYRYRVYDDVRLVATPHLQSAKFGGDPDNFTYPRFGLDFAMVRVWQDGHPLDSSDFYLPWKTSGAEEGETVFTVGFPGDTGRLKTVAQMEYLRDEVYPQQIERIEQMLASMYERAEADPAQAKAMRSRILNMENARKAFQGYLDGLRNERIMAAKAKAEAEIRRAVAENPELSRRFGDPWADIEALIEEMRTASSRAEQRELARREQLLEKRIGEAYFAVYGTTIPPDATGTLRISDGRVAGYPYNGTIAPWFTSLYGLYARHTEFGGRPPFNLPQIWLDKEADLDLHTPFNFVCTCDIIGGNSGSPVVNTEGELVGLAFDGNIEMLGNMYVYDDAVARTVAVHPSIVIEALKVIFGADELVEEIEGTGPGYD